MISAYLIAHQGGWDEVLLVAGPVLILGLLLVLANRRADKAVTERDRKDREHHEPDQTDVDSSG